MPAAKASRSASGTVIQDDFRAVALRGGDLHLGASAGMTIAAGCRGAAGERDRLGVVARGERDDTSLALLRRETRERVVGAAELEGAMRWKFSHLKKALVPVRASKVRRS